MPSTQQDPITGKPCIHCSFDDSFTHSTEEHNENYVAELEECDECGAPSGEGCKPSCRWAECPHCGQQQDNCNFGRNH